MDTPGQTAYMLACVDRMQAGDQAARDELVRGFGVRLERLARKMLRRFPRVGRWVETDDVLQNALLRLLRALQEIRPTSTAELFHLAAEQIRRELLDLARHFYGPHGEGAHHASLPPETTSSGPALDPQDRDDDARELERWLAFHEGVASLPTEEREVVGLIFYHGWTQAEVADLFRVTVRTVQRRWQSALLKLRHVVGKDETIS
jgi:RNA polymerase sigma-70 factor (ECF subfamily)